MNTEIFEASVLIYIALKSDKHNNKMYINSTAV